MSALPPKADIRQCDHDVCFVPIAEVGRTTPPAPSTAAMPVPQSDATSKFDVNVTASITSDYNYRGYTLSDHKPSASTSFEATYNILFADVTADSMQIRCSRNCR